MAVVNIQIVVAALGVSLQVKNAECEHDHVSFWDLETERLWMSQTRRHWVRKESVLRHVAGEVTHGDAPGAFAVGFVEGWEALAANEARVRDQVTSTVEHGPVKKDPVRQWGRGFHGQDQRCCDWFPSAACL